MSNPIIISDAFVNTNTDFPTLITALSEGFACPEIMVPRRHHHNFPNLGGSPDSTLLLMPAWRPGNNAGVKIATVSPENDRYGLPSIHALYVLLNAENGSVKAIIQAKSLTANRTAATSALASTFLSRTDASSLLMIGTGVLSAHLIRAHASVRPIKKVYIWGRNFAKAEAVVEELTEEPFSCKAVAAIEEKIADVDIISCATLSSSPLVLGANLRPGQHIDLVGAYKKDMREADDSTIERATVFVDSLEGKEESGDIFIPLEKEILAQEDIQGDLFSLCSDKIKGRINDRQITLFKSVGHALEDLVGASYYYNKFINAPNISK